MSVIYKRQTIPAARLLMKTGDGSWWVYLTGVTGEDPRYKWDRRMYEYASDSGETCWFDIYGTPYPEG